MTLPPSSAIGHGPGGLPRFDIFAFTLKINSFFWRFSFSFSPQSRLQLAVSKKFPSAEKNCSRGLSETP
jgi:hypothetical protein